MNKSNDNAVSAGTEADSSTTADGLMSSPNSSNTNVVRSAFSCPPYELSRQEFKYFNELYKSQGSGLFRATKGCFNNLQKHMEMLHWLSFGVHAWLFKKALDGDEEAKFKLEHSYNLYDEVILKAKEQNLL